MNSRFLISTLVVSMFLFSGCIWKELGARGDGSLSRNGNPDFGQMFRTTVPKAAYQLSFKNAPLDQKGKTTFQVSNLDETGVFSIRITLLSPEAIAPKKRESHKCNVLSNSGIANCVFNLKIDSPDGELFSERVEVKNQKWLFVGRVNFKEVEWEYDVGDRNISKDFSVTIDVIEPSKTIGDSIRIEGFGIVYGEDA